MQPIDPRLHVLRDVLVGQVLQGTGGVRFHIRERIGEGGQGWVFKANWDEPDGFVVIVKVLRPDSVTAETLSRFQREAEALRRLAQHSRPNPHIVRFFDHSVALINSGVGEPLRLPFTVLEFVNGPTLEQIRHRATGQGLAPDRARRILRHVVLALEAVHAQGIVHRDLKPSNILLATDDGGEVAKVTDFGLAKLVDINLQRTSSLAGASLGYAPPEQYEQGNQRVGPRTDVFSLAAITYEMLSGKVAFPYRERENPLLIVSRIAHGPRPSLAADTSGIPADLRARTDLLERIDAELLRGMNPDPGKRHESVTQFWNALDPLLRSVLDGGRPSLPQSIVPSILQPSQAPQPSHQPPPQPSAHLSEGAMRSARPSDPGDARALSADRNSAHPSAWTWRVLAPPVRPEIARTAAFSSNGVGVIAGKTGLFRLEPQGWSAIALPQSIDVRAIRTVTWLSPTDLLVLGGRGLAARVGLGGGGVDIWSISDRSLTFRGALVDESNVWLVGDRATSDANGHVGIVAQTTDGRLRMVCDAARSVKLRSMTRLRGGPLVACGDRGALVVVDRGTASLHSTICGGNLHAISALPDGGAVTIGAGGHALNLTPKLTSTLEAVQTTRDLFALALAPDGAAWAGAAQARILRRIDAQWVRINIDLSDASVLALFARGRTIVAILDDGGTIEGSLGAPGYR